MKLELDGKIKCVQERLKIVEKICEEHEDELTNYNLEQLANYLIIQAERDERAEEKKGMALTPNRMATVNKRETSLEGLSTKFINGEDGVYNIMNEDKNTILSPKVSITKQDIEEIPFIKQIRDTVLPLEMIQNRDYITQQAIIDLYRTQYIIKEAYKPTIMSKCSSIPTPPPYDWDELIDFSDQHSAKCFLHNYSRLKSSSWGRVRSDMYWMLLDFERLTDAALEDEPMLYDIMVAKIDGLQNNEIQTLLEYNHGDTFSQEYISSLYNNKIPRLIAEKQQELDLIWHYTHVEKGSWKKCNRCGEVKLLHSKFYSKNSGSSTGFYSICKQCRNKKK